MQLSQLRTYWTADDAHLAISFLDELRDTLWATYGPEIIEQRQQENQQIGIPLDMIRTFPKRLQELIGFAPYQGVIGHCDRRSPMAMFDASNTQSLANVFPASAE